MAAAQRSTTRTALLGLALGLAGLLGYFVVVFRLAAYLPRVRNDAVPNWLLVLAGLALSVRAGGWAAPGRRLVPRILLGVNALVAVAFVLVLYVVPRVPPADGPAVAAAAPDFTVTDQTGRTVRLADFRGSPLLLVFYRGHW